VAVGAWPPLHAGRKLFFYLFVQFLSEVPSSSSISSFRFLTAEVTTRLLQDNGKRSNQESRQRLVKIDEEFNCRLVRTIFFCPCSIFTRHSRVAIKWPTGEWLENQILIPHWTYFHYPGATLLTLVQVSSFSSSQCRCPPTKALVWPGQ